MEILEKFDRWFRPDRYRKKDFRVWIKTIAEDDERIDALYHLLHSESPELIDWVKDTSTGNKDDLSLIEIVDILGDNQVTKGEKK